MVQKKGKAATNSLNTEGIYAVVVIQFRLCFQEVATKAILV